MDTGKVYICECHFEPKDIELTSKFIFNRFASRFTTLNYFKDQEPVVQKPINANQPISEI